MKTQSLEAPGREGASAGAVLLWCLLAAGIVAPLLLLEPPEGRGLEFWNPDGALRLLVDLLLFTCIFLVGAFRTPRARPAAAWLLSTGVILYTGVLGVVMINYLVGLGAWPLVRLVSFVVLVAGGVGVWTFALSERRGVYYSVASIAALGVPVVGFFCDELFRIEARWLDVVSPFTAWRVVAAQGGGAWRAWVLFGAVLVSGAAATLIRRRGRRA